MGSTVISISDPGLVSDKRERMSRTQVSVLIAPLKRTFAKGKFGEHGARKFIHSMKVGTALIFVSLLYLVDPLYDEVGDNAMWAIMTVVVIFEFFAGATLSKGLNRGLGTILGGLLGFVVASMARFTGGIGDDVIVATSVFMFGAAATYLRLVPKIKKRYDYGVMIFILTFNLIVVSGVRTEKVLEVACVRLATVVMGFTVCVFTSMTVFPMWASDELHNTVASRFCDLAASIDGYLKEYFGDSIREGENRTNFNFSVCKAVLHSKPQEESMINFAKWEPWHGRFGFSHPWHKYQQIGDLHRDLAATILSLNACLQFPAERSSESLRWSIKEPCESMGSSIAWVLRQLGESMVRMRKCKLSETISPKLETLKEELSLAVVSPSGLKVENNMRECLATMKLLHSLMEMADKVEELTNSVEELAQMADFADH